MGTYTKIKPAGLTKLNNAEYTNFMNAFYRLAFAAGGGGGDSESPDEISLDNNPLGITDAQKTAFEKELPLMTDLVNQSHISDETAQLLDLDKQRDDLVVYLTTSVAAPSRRNARRHRLSTILSNPISASINRPTSKRRRRYRVFC